MEMFASTRGTDDNVDTPRKLLTNKRRLKLLIKSAIVKAISQRNRLLLLDFFSIVNA